MNKWPHEVTQLTTAEITTHCVKSAGWQSFRESLKGLPTTEKLDRLAHWRQMDIDGVGLVRRRCQVQIDNYINALKRGGQLNMNLEVVR